MGIKQRPNPRAFTIVVSRTSQGHPDYVCDGVDDDVQIQAAIDDVAAAGGGTVFLRAGTYNMTDSVYTVGAQENVHLMGEGMGLTILKRADSSPAGAGGVDLNTSNCSISHLTLDGNKANNSTHSSGVGINSFWNSNIVNIVAERVEVKNMKRATFGGIGIYVGGPTSYFKVKDCYIHDNDHSGYESDASSSGGYGVVEGCIFENNDMNGVWEDKDFGMIFRNCAFIGNSLYGIEAQAARAIIEGCVSRSNSSAGYYLSGVNIILRGSYSIENGEGVYSASSGSIITGCEIINNEEHGIRVQGSSDYVITNNIISTGTRLIDDDTYSGIKLGGPTSRSVIIGNRIYKIGSGNSYKYGIEEISASADKNIITNNIVTGAATAQILSQGPDSDVSHNITS